MEFADFTHYGYEVTHKLSPTEPSSNQGKLTWQGKEIASDRQVVIKQFCFGNQDNSWQDYDTFQQEITYLKQLEHQGIPQFITSFETENSFCYVREYIPGKSLAEITITSSLVVKVAVQTLQILLYLQQQTPPIFHLNLTPENILINEQGKVFLIGFSRAQQDSSLPKSSAIALDNAEFIAPEQLKSPGFASDLYGLGTSLAKVILLQPDLSLDQLPEGIPQWLEKLANPEVQARYSDAETALKALQANSWEEITAVSDLVPKESGDLSNQAYGLGLVGMGALSMALVVGYQVTQVATEKSFINIAIALMAMGIIYLTQSASATIITNEPGEKQQAIIFAVATPLVLALVTGLIFGKGEAVAVSFTATFAQVLVLGSTLFSPLAVGEQRDMLRAMGLVGAITLGMVCGVWLM